MERDLLIQAEQQPSRMGWMRNRLLALTMTGAAFLGSGMAPEKAHADTPTPIELHTETTDTQLPGIEPDNLSLAVDQNGDQYLAFTTIVRGGGNDVRVLIRNGENPPIVKQIYDTGQQMGDLESTSLVMNNAASPNLLLFFESAHQGAKGFRLNTNGDILEGPISIDRPGTSIDAKMAPDGQGLGLAYTKNVGNSQELHYRYYPDANDLSHSVNTLVATNLKLVRKISLVYGVDGKPKIGFNEDKDAMIILGQDVENWATSDSPAVLTALDTASNDRAVGGFISLVDSAQGIRGSYLDTNDGDRLRVGSLVISDQSGDSTGAKSATVDGDINNGYGTSTQVLSDGSTAVVYGADNGLRFAVCPADTTGSDSSQNSDCTKSNEVADLDTQAEAVDPIYKIAPNGEASAVYVTNPDLVRDSSGTIISSGKLMLITGATETFGINMGQQPRQNAVQNRSSLNGPSISVPTTPNPNYLRPATELRYIIGKKIVDACKGVLIDADACDKFWHSGLPLNP